MKGVDEGKAVRHPERVGQALNLFIRLSVICGYLTLPAIAGMTAHPRSTSWSALGASWPGADAA